MMTEDKLHAKSLSVEVGDLGTVTVWRYASWEPFTWHYRAEKPDGRSYQGKTFTRWGAKTEAYRFLDPAWDEIFQ